MAETEVAAPPVGTETKTEAKVVSAGKPQPVKLNLPDQVSQNGNSADAGAAAATAVQETAEQKTVREAKELEEKNKPPELSEEQRKAYLAKELGIENFDGNIDALKEKLKPAPAAASPEDVEKQKVAAEQAFEKRMVDYYLEHGGTVDQFANLKTIASADLKQLSESEIRREMKEAKDKDGKSLFDDNEIAVVLKERYYQINPEEIVRGEDETEEDFNARKALTEKKIAFGSKKLESKSSHIKKQAESALSTLRELIKSQDAQKAEDVQHSKRVEDYFQKLPRTVKFELGKAADEVTDIAPIEFPIPEDMITEVAATLKDPDKRKQFLYNEGGSLNLDNVGAIMLENKYLKEALKTVYSAGGSRQVEAFEKRFPGRIAKDIGVGGNNGGGANQPRRGEVTGAGKPQVVRHNT